MKIRSRKYTLIMLAICVGAILLSAILGSIVQTSFWSVKVTDLRDETNVGTKRIQAVDATEAKDYVVNGKVVSGILYVPSSATAEHPAPAAVFTHGYLNNRELQEQFAIEMARRGWVVLTIDRQGHGNNTTTTNDNYGDPMLSAAKYLYNLTDANGDRIVDGDKIAVSGHSMGGMATNSSMALDGVDTKGTIKVSGTSYAWEGATDEALSKGYHMGIISIGMPQAQNPAPASYGSNLLGVASIGSTADEFFYKSTTKNPVYVGIDQDKMTSVIFAQGQRGTYSGSVDGKVYIKKGNDYVAVTENDRFGSSKQYYAFSTNANTLYFLQSEQAMKFVGIDTATWTEEQYNIGNGTVYNYTDGGSIVGNADGKQLLSLQNGGTQVAERGTKSLRACYRIVGNHPMVHFSTGSTSHAIDFLYLTCGTPVGARYIGANNQVWWLKETFAIFGIIGLAGLVIALVDILLQTSMFKSLQVAEGEVEEKTQPLLKSPRRHISYWLGGILTAWFGYYSWTKTADWTKTSVLYGWMNQNVSQITGLTYQNWQNATLFAYWGVICAVFAVVITALIWFANRIVNMIMYKDEYLQHDSNPFAALKIRSGKNVVKTMALSAIVVTVVYGLIFLLWDLFVVDFRFWTVQFKVFNLNNLLSYLRLAPWFAIFYVINAALNVNYRAKDLPEWATIIINVAFNVGWLLIMLLAYNLHFQNTGAFVDSTLNMKNIWVYPFIPIIGIATVLSRRLYVRTGNAWLAGLINATIVAILTCSGTCMAGTI